MAQLILIFAVGFIFIFTIEGVTGVILANSGINCNAVEVTNLSNIGSGEFTAKTIKSFLKVCLIFFISFLIILSAFLV